MRRGALVLAVVAALVCAPDALAAKRCAEPGASSWQRATPAEAGMDAAKLADALDDSAQSLSLSVRVFRHGCLVAADPLEAANRNTQCESW